MTDSCAFVHGPEIGSGARRAEAVAVGLAGDEPRAGPECGDEAADAPPAPWARADAASRAGVPQPASVTAPARAIPARATD